MANITQVYYWTGELKAFRVLLLIQTFQADFMAAGILEGSVEIVGCEERLLTLVANIWRKLSVDLGNRTGRLECCGKSMATQLSKARNWSKQSLTTLASTYAHKMLCIS
jgi:hypothetical protein